MRIETESPVGEAPTHVGVRERAEDDACGVALDAHGNGIRAVVELMAADPARLVHRNAFNIAAINFTPAELAAEIRKHLPDFRIEYDVDPVRQRIADSWPESLDDSAARAEWGWKPRYDLAAMVAEMLRELRVKLRLSES